jgi:hypothetical protein
MSTTLPTLASVSVETLKNFLNAVAGNITVDDKNELPKIVETKGRCVRVHLNGFAPNWHEKAELLIGGCGRPCEEFRIDGNFLTARLKTETQTAADGAAFDLDEAPGELQTYWPFFDEDAKPAAPRTKSEIAASKKKTKVVPEGKAAPAVLRVMERDYPMGAVDREELISLTKATLEPDVDARGDDRRRKYIKQAIDALVKRKFLRVCGEDDEQLELIE